MLKKSVVLSTLAALSLFVMTINAQTNVKTNDKSKMDNKPATGAVIHPRAELRDDIMEEDELEGTDTLAIPLDDSAVEDEALLDRMEGKPFELPTKK
ncbi:MAG: hypothetical protein H0W88_10030 [Parachlamydiaceae bacterium]|nr:hypothetical protein [Parachlamydiaceae bacterium]